MKNQTTKSLFKIDWTFNQKPVIGLPMCNHPLTQLPVVAWIVKALATLIKILENINKYTNLSFFDEVDRTKIKEINARATKLLKEFESMDPDTTINEADQSFLQVMSLIADFSNYTLQLKSKGGARAATASTTRAVTSGWGLERYEDIFQTIELPPVVPLLRDDRMFAYWRVAGNNPVMLKKVTQLPDNFPLTNRQYKEVMGNADSLTKALAEKRLYLVDYKDVGKLAVEDGVFKAKTGMGYSFAPIALFAIPQGQKHLMPVAIQCGQDASQNRIFIRSAKRDYYWGWQMAKYVVQVAEENYHEIFTHLGFTHLVSEVFAVATLKNFSNKHVLKLLLKNHFEGTNFINWGATVALLRKEQFIDTLFAADLPRVYEETLEKRFNFHFYDMMLPKHLKDRGVDNVAELPDYPYRDDGMLIWNAIKTWVTDYINLYYPDDAAIAADKELMAWVDDIIANGKINGFIKIKTIEQLIDVLTMVIFTASAQHAAVNFSQPDWMRYAPAISATSAAKAPYSQTGKSNIDWNNMLQNYDQALQKFTIYSLLGGVYHGVLGQYNKSYYKEGTVFSDVNVNGPDGILARFRQNLLTIENEINTRNKTRFLSYEYLLPSKIPASTNI